MVGHRSTPASSHPGRLAAGSHARSSPGRRPGTAQKPRNSGNSSAALPHPAELRHPPVVPVGPVRDLVPAPRRLPLPLHLRRQEPQERQHRLVRAFRQRPHRLQVPHQVQHRMGWRPSPHVSRESATDCPYRRKSSRVAPCCSSSGRADSSVPRPSGQSPPRKGTSSRSRIAFRARSPRSRARLLSQLRDVLRAIPQKRPLPLPQIPHQPQPRRFPPPPPATPPRTRPRPGRGSPSPRTHTRPPLSLLCFRPWFLASSVSVRSVAPSAVAPLR